MIDQLCIIISSNNIALLSFIMICFIVVQISFIRMINIDHYGTYVRITKFCIYCEITIILLFSIIDMSELQIEIFNFTIEEIYGFLVFLFLPQILIGEYFAFWDCD